MLTNVSSADYLITGDAVQQKESVQGVDKKALAKEIYSKVAEFTDSAEISPLAKELLQRDEDIKKFTSLALAHHLTDEEQTSIAKFLENQDIADSMQDDSDLMSFLFSL